MLKETPRSLRQYFGLVAGLCLLSAALDLTHGAFSVGALAQFLLNLGSGVAFAYIAFRLPALLFQPRFVYGTLIFCAAWTLFSFATSSRSGVTLQSVAVFAISILILVYLAKSVARLSRESLQKNA